MHILNMKGLNVCGCNRHGCYVPTEVWTRKLYLVEAKYFYYLNVSFRFLFFIYLFISLHQTFNWTGQTCHFSIYTNSVRLHFIGET